MYKGTGDEWGGWNGDRERHRSRDEQSQSEVKGSYRSALSWFSIAIVIYFTNILSKNRNGTMTSASSPKKMGIWLGKSNGRASLLELFTKAHQQACNWLLIPPKFQGFLSHGLRDPNPKGKLFYVSPATDSQLVCTSMTSLIVKIKYSYISW